MSRRIIRRAEARRDLLEHFVYIGRDKLSASVRFLKAAESTFKRLARSPSLGSSWETSNSSYVGLRVWPIKGFENHLVFFRRLDDGIEIVRVLHAARDIESVFEP
jgi:toxin ParE1/3/4